MRSDDEKRKILWDNCARFYSVTAPAAVRQGERRAQTPAKFFPKK